MPSDVPKNTRTALWFPNASIFALWLALTGFFVFGAWIETFAKSPSAADTHYKYIALFAAVFFLAAGAFTLPLTIVIDARTGEILIRSPLRVKRVRLDEADGVKLLYDDGTSRVYYALVFRKEFVRPPLRLCSSRRRTAKFIETFRKSTLHKVQELLDLWRIRHPAPPPVPSPAGPPLWQRDNGGWRLSHPAANASAGVFMALMVMCILAMIWFIPVYVPDGDSYSLSEIVFMSGLAAALLIGSYCLMEYMVPHNLRFDPQKGTLVRRGWRGLFRKKLKAEDCEFLTLHQEDKLLSPPKELLLRFRNSRTPLLLIRSRSPEVLRQAVRETSALFGRDPQEFFVPHGREVKAEPH